MDLKTKLKLYLIATWGLMSAKNDEERAEIIKLLDENLKKNGDE